MKNKVSVVIPIYQNRWSENENLSLAQAIKILSRYPIVIVKPQSLDLSFIQNIYPQVTFENFDDKYFQGISGYNSLMLSTVFYERFLQYDYVLIYQLDAWVFRDELEYWCDKGYDYIGAPWIVKPKYNLLPMRIFAWLKTKYYKLTGKIFVQEMRKNKVGNGGFSLRKIQSFYRATLERTDKIEYFLEQPRIKGKTIFNEDFFWAVENPDFMYPPHMEALRFSFDIYPHVCLKMNNKALPFGCHAWTYHKNINFWKDFIVS